MNFILTNYGQSWFDNHPGELPLLSAFKVGSESNYIPDPSDIGIRGTELFEGTPSAPRLLASGEIQYVVLMDASVGDFSWGEIGLYHSGSLFAIGAASSLMLKRKTTGAQAGNRVTLNAVMSADSMYVAAQLANSSNELNIQVRTNIDSLAPAHLSTPNIFVVPHPADLTKTTIAYAAAGSWSVAGYSQEVGVRSITAATALVLTLDSAIPEPSYTGEFIVSIESGQASGLIRSVASFNAVSNSLVLASTLPWNPEAGDIVRIWQIDDLGNQSVYDLLRGLSPTLTAADLNQLEDLTTFFGPLVPRDGSRAMTGNLALGGHRITGVSDPITDTDAANKQYVDQAVASGGIPSGVLRTDGTVPMAAALDMDGHPIRDVGNAILGSDALNLAQFQSLLSAALVDVMQADGSVVATGNQDMGGNKITGLANATLPTEAVNLTVLNNAVAALSAAAMLRSGTQAMQAPLNMGNFRLTNVAQAVNSTDGVNLLDVTSRLLGFVPRDGSQPMTGPFNAGLFRVTNMGAPVMSTDGVNLIHLQNSLNTLLTTVLKLDGSNSMAEDLDMGGQRLTSLADPINLADGVNLASLQAAISTSNAAWTAGALLRNGTNAMLADLNAGNFRVTNLASPALPTDAVPLGTLTTEINGLRAAAVLRNGTQAMTADLPMGGFRITGLSPANAAGQAVEYQQLQSEFQFFAAVSMLLDGSQAMVGALNMGSQKIINLLNPANPQDAATKGYVDNRDEFLLALDGTRAMNGVLNMGNNRVSALANPVTGSDAATKNYVDQAIIGVSPIGVLKDDGTVPMQADLSLGGFRVVNSGAPTGGNDLTNKTYVDGLIATRLPVDGSVAMAGDLQMGNFRVRGTLDPLLGTDAATKNYVDTRDNLNVARDGSRPMGAHLSMNSFRIQALAAPVSGTDAANKDYVDDSFTAFGLTVVHADGTVPMTGPLSMSGQKVTGLGAPTAASDAANKSYVDSLRAAAMLLNGSQAMTADLPMGGFKITNMSAPSANTDAATKLYVDNAVAGISPTSYLRRDGTDQMVGHLNMGIRRILNMLDPVDPQDGSTKAYVDSAVAGLFRRDGSLALTGDMSAGGFKISNLATPTLGSDAATRDYVLSVVAGSSGDLLKADGSVAMTSAFNAGGFRMTNVAAPTLSGDATTKNYVDATVSGAVNTLAATVLLKDGSVPLEAALDMGGFLINNVSNPAAPNDAANKSYVDSVFGSVGAAFLRVDGTQAMEANLNLDSFKLTNVSDPTAAQDAATKNYVDGQLTSYAPRANPSFTGNIGFDGRQLMNVEGDAAGTIDCSTGNVFSLTVSINTILSFTNPPAAGSAYLMSLVINHSAGTITFPPSVTWPDGVPPTLNTGKVHVINLITIDGGTKWRVSLSANHDV